MKTTFISVGAFILVLFAAAEIVLALPVKWTLYFGVSLLLLTGLLVPGGSDRSRSRFENAVLVVCVAIAWTLFLFPWNSRKPFLKAFDRIEVGMTETEVREIMAGYMEGTGWKFPPKAAAEIESESESGGGGLVEVGSGARMETGVSDSGELELENSVVFRHSNDGAYNSDWGVVSFENGRVTGTRFMPD